MRRGGRSRPEDRGCPRVLDPNDAGSFSGPATRDTGFCFYFDAASNAVTGYELKDGRFIEQFAGGSDSEFIKQIERIGFQPFDFDVEASRVLAAIQKEAESKGMSVLAPVSLDGAEFEIRCVNGAVDYRLRRWNPMTDIDFCAPRSGKIAKLKALIDFFTSYYGRKKMLL